MKKLFLFILILHINFFPQGIEDIIKLINLSSGETDTLLISDIFYSEDYNLKFQKNDNIEVKFDPEKKILVLIPKENFEGMDLITFNFTDKIYQIPLRSEIKQKHTFNFKPKEKIKKVTLFGSFNAWNRNNLLMEDPDKDGVFEITMSLEPGLYEYKFFADGEELIDPSNPDQKPRSKRGGFNSILNIEQRHSGKAYLHILEKIITHSGYKLSFYYEKENQKEELRLDNIIALAGNEKIPDEQITIDDKRILLFLDGKKYISPEDILIRIAVTQNGQSTNMQQVVLQNKKTLHDMIIYSIMIDRFYDGDKSNSIPVDHPELHKKANYQGGDLQGIIDKINEGYFTSLGINTLWISPVNDNTGSAYKEYPPPHRFYSGYHGYWPVSSTNVEEHFGDMKLLNNLINKAHEKGIKILLDFVSNHIHIEHPFWIEHREWFGMLNLPDGRKNLRLWDEHRLTTWFEPYMPSFDYVGSKEALEAMTDNAIWWLKETNADGFRHDAVKHVPNEFWRMLTEKVKQEIEIPENKIVYQIGETFGNYDLVSSYVNNGQLSAQFNFNLYDIALPVFLNDEASFTLLDNEMKKTFSIYGSNHLMGNVIDSHDKVRYMAYADGDISLSEGNTSDIGWKNPPEVNKELSYKKLKLHLAYILTIPGIPVIYYGDEIGMTGAADPDNRRMMRFDDQLNDWEKVTLRDVKKIINLRNDHSALRRGDFLTLISDEDCYAYLRSDGNERVLVCLNKSNSEKTLNISLPEFYNLKSAEDILSGKRSNISDSNFSFTIHAVDWVLFKLE